MISRLEFPDGIDLPLDPNTMQAKVAGIVVARLADLELLDQGIYDVAPKIWTKNLHNHELTVLDNGQGLYRIYPRDPEFGFIESASQTGMTNFRRGGRVNDVNAEQPVAVIGGGHPKKRELQMFGLIIYL